MPRSLKVCSTPGCPAIVEHGRCADCRAKAEQQRGTSAQRGYTGAHRTRFREAVLTKHVVCRCDQPGKHGHGPVCSRASQHADHWPRSRRELEALDLDPNDPQYGRGLCARCHSAVTAADPNQRGGWNRRD